MRSPFVDFTVLDSANNTAAETAFEFESPFINNESYATSPEEENLYLSDEADFEQTDDEMADELSNDFIADETYHLQENSTQQIEGPDPGISKELWELMGESIEYDVPKAGTSKDIAAQVSKYFSVSTKVITSYDWAFQRPWSDRFKELVEWAAAQVNLNPGLVAANFIAETKATDYLGGTVSSFVVGTDDFYDKRADMKKKVPVFTNILWKRDTAYLTDVNERGRTVNTVYFKTGKDAALANAVYLKHGEEVLREEATRLGKNFDDIPLERCFAFLRLAFKAGHGRAKKNLNEYLLKNKEVLILKPQSKAGPQRLSTIRTAQAIYLSETFFAQPLNLVLKETDEVDQQMESYSRSKEQVKVEDQVSVVNPPACSIKVTKKNKIKFEFDLLVNMTSDLCITQTIDPDVHKSISEHIRKKDGFKLKIDGNKIEVNTHEFKLTDEGKTKLIDAFKNINTWITDLKSAFEDKTNRKPINIKKGTCSGCPTCIAGKGISIETAKIGKTLKIKDEFITANHFIFPLRAAITKTPEQFQNYFIDRIDVRAVPQVTMGIPLSSVSKLVDIICENKAGDVGVVGTDLTGGNKVRIGVRSDYLFNAQYRVNAARAYFLKTGTFGSLKITNVNFSDSLTGFMILLVQYLWITVLRNYKDGEDFVKACVPLHSKTRFREMFHCLLNDEERELFIKVFWENDNWKNLFSLVKNIKQKPRSNECFTNTGGNFNIIDAPDFKLFPQVNRSDYTNPTWREFITSIVENNHSLEPDTGSETLITWPAQAHELKSNGVFLEFRRMGFGTFSSDKWQAMAERLFEIARKLNETSTIVQELSQEDFEFQNEESKKSNELEYYEIVEESDLGENENVFAHNELNAEAVSDSQQLENNFTETETGWWSKHRLLKKADRGIDVGKMQGALKSKWGIPVRITNLYDDDTVKAVIQFQKVNNLEQDGILGPFTHAILFESNYRYAISKPRIVIQASYTCWAACFESAIPSWKGRTSLNVSSLISKYKSFLAARNDITYNGFSQVIKDFNGGETSGPAKDFRIETVKKLLLASNSHLIIVHSLLGGSVAHAEVVYGFGVRNGSPYLLVMDPLLGTYAERSLGVLQQFGGNIIIVNPK